VYILTALFMLTVCQLDDCGSVVVIVR